MKYCSQCGAENDDDARFCDNCAEDISISSHIPASAYRHKKRRIAVIVFLMALVFLLFFSRSVITLNIPFAPTRKSVSVAETQKTASKMADVVFGNDERVESLSGPMPPLQPDLKDVEHSDSFSYSIRDCNTLFSDVVQQAGHSVEKELTNATKISEEEENNVGRKFQKEMDKRFRGTLDIDKELLVYIDNLGRHLIGRVKRPGIAYHFHVIRQDEVNAFSIPGGGVYVFTGLLKQLNSESELVAVIAHEIRHIDLRHCIALYQVFKRLPEAAQSPITYSAAQMARHPFNARNEAEADMRGLELTYSLGYSPYGFAEFWEKNASGSAPAKRWRGQSKTDNALGQIVREVENVALSHPKNEKRACLLKNHIVRLQKEYPQSTGYVGKWNLENKVTMFEKKI